MNWDKTQKVFIGTVNRLIEMKYITVNHLISIEGIASQFTNDLSTLETEEEKHREISQMITIFEKHYPQLFKEFLVLLKGKK